MAGAWGRLRALLGIELSPVGHLERLISAATGLVAIFLLVHSQTALLGSVGAALLISSMGSSAVLLFAVPHGALSQPWAVIVGHAVSAVIGVTTARFVPDLAIASALSVGISIGAMHYLRAIHPPAGATALAAVIGGPQVHDLGFAFVLTPVLSNTLVMVALAVLLNAAFAWRRYPAAFKPKKAANAAAGEAAALTHADFVAALRQLGTFVDISEDEFLRLRDLMREAAETRTVKPADIRLGAYYSNGASGTDWSVRRIVDLAPGENGSVIWRVVAGPNRNEQGHSTRESFASWATCEVARGKTAWVQQSAAADIPKRKPAQAGTGGGGSPASELAATAGVRGVAAGAT